MLKMRLEFITEEDLQNMLFHLEQRYIIVDKSTIRHSNRANSKYKLIYVELVKK